MKSFSRKTIALLLLVCAFLMLFSSCGKKQEYYTSYEQLMDKTIALSSGTKVEKDLLENHPDVNVVPMNTLGDMMMALDEGRVDSFANALGLYPLFKEAMPTLTYLEGYEIDVDYAIAFAKTVRGETLLKEFNTFLAELQNNGEFDRLTDKWINNPVGGYDLEFEINSWPGNNGTVKLLAAACTEPFTYIHNNELSGFDIQLIEMFCREHDYKLEYKEISLDGLLPGLAGGEYDMACSGLETSPERRANVNFSEPVNCDKTVLFVFADPKTVPGYTEPTFFEKLSDSFYKNFLLEDRWVMIVKGIGTTLAITVASALIGSVLGFGLYMFSRKRGKVFTKIVDIIAWLIGNLPMVITLMILYYIVLANTKISSVTVSIIAFSVSLALTVYSLLDSAVSTINYGQTEGAYSIGLTDAQAFYKIILPQALGRFIPDYKSALIALIQGTAIVGYIAVEDLTKASDIIRSRTYEAFFPLIATAIIYLILGWLLTLIVSRVEVNTDPKKRTAAEILQQYKE